MHMMGRRDRRLISLRLLHSDPDVPLISKIFFSYFFSRKNSYYSFKRSGDDKKRCSWTAPGMAFRLASLLAFLSALFVLLTFRNEVILIST